MPTKDKESIGARVDGEGKGREVAIITEREDTLLPAMPSPGDMQGYESVLPGFAERVLSMAEKQQKDMHESNRIYHNNMYRLISKEQIFTFAISIAGIMAAIYGFSVDIGFPAALVAIAAVSYSVWRLVKNKNK